MKDIDFRTLRLVLGPPSATSAEIIEGYERAAYRWSCGCSASEVPRRTFCDVNCCDFHRDALIPSEANRQIG